MNQTYKGSTLWQKRYCEAHYKHYERTLPGIIADGHYCLPKFPDVKTTNGITTFIINLINWSGGLAERTGTEGRVIKGKDYKTADGGTIVGKTIRIKNSGKGKTDLAVTFRGKSIRIEVKNKYTKDRFKEIDTKTGKQSKQAEYRDKAIRAGAIHYIATDVDSFLEWWGDKIETI